MINRVSRGKRSLDVLTGDSAESVSFSFSWGSASDGGRPSFASVTHTVLELPHCFPEVAFEHAPSVVPPKDRRNRRQLPRASAPGVSAQFKMLSDRLHLHGRLRSKPVRSGRPGMHAPRYFRFLRARQLEWQMMTSTPHACSRLVAFPRLQVS
jgi:hypothetical protein